MKIDFVIKATAAKEDLKIWGILAHVSKEAREQIKNSSGAEFKQYIKYITYQVTQLNKRK